jgi:hypothetical protein
MLAVRIIEESDCETGLENGCSLCGKPAAHYLITPWDHIDVCDECAAMAHLFFRKVDAIKRACKERDYEEHFDHLAKKYFQATSP